MVKRYAGIGSRSTPPEVLDTMRRLATILYWKGYTLRSGGASGADTAFAAGTEDKEIFRAATSTIEAENEASRIHPNWFRLNSFVRALHGRNVQIILGFHLNEPVEFVVCWTPNAEVVGGTRTGIVCAKTNGIPIYNLADPEQAAALDRLIIAMPNRAGIDQWKPGP